MPVKRKSKPKHPWYARKGYLHFDFALDIADATRYVRNPNNIIKHKFSPFIHYVKLSRKVKRKLDEERVWKAAGKPVDQKPRLETKPKARNIFYAPHIDGYIYSYYTSLIQAAYDKHLKANNLSNNVIAYRSIQKDKTKYSNIHFARDAFAFIDVHADINVSCFDLSKFFDRLDTTILKTNWTKVLNKSELPDDHAVLHRQLSNFTFVEETDLIDHFSNNFLKTPRKHGFDFLTGGSKNHRICNYKELRQLHANLKSTGGKLIHPKGDLEITGIAQGSAISGLLANIFMLDFDLALKVLIEEKGGLYLRYSDDIFTAFPTTVTHSDMDQIVFDTLVKTCGTSVTINADKTERALIKKTNGKLQVLTPDGLKENRVQYLGFHLSSHGIHIRNSSISKDRGKTVESIAAAQQRKNHGKIDTRSIYKTKSHRKTTSHNPVSEKGFINYASRSAKILDNSETIKTQIRKSDRFIRRAVERKRQEIASD